MRLIDEVVEVLKKHPEGLTLIEISKCVNRSPSRIISSMTIDVPIYQTDGKPCLYFLMNTGGNKCSVKC